MSCRADFRRAQLRGDHWTWVSLSNDRRPARVARKIGPLIAKNMSGDSASRVERGCRVRHMPRWTVSRHARIGHAAQGVLAPGLGVAEWEVFFRLVARRGLVGVHPRVAAKVDGAGMRLFVRHDSGRGRDVADRQSAATFR